MTSPLDPAGLEAAAKALGEQWTIPGATRTEHAEAAVRAYLAAAAADERLREAAGRLLVAFAAEEDEHGFPFSFELRDAHRALVAAADRDKPQRNHAPWCEGGHGDTPCPAPPVSDNPVHAEPEPDGGLTGSAPPSPHGRDAASQSYPPAALAAATRMVLAHNEAMKNLALTFPDGVPPQVQLDTAYDSAVAIAATLAGRFEAPEPALSGEAEANSDV